MTDRMKILIGYDGSQCADAAIDDLARAGLPGEAEALILSTNEVWLPPPSMFDVLGRPLADHHERGVELALAHTASTRERLQALFPRWHVRIKGETGDPGERIVEEAGGWNADLVVVGSHGRTALGRFFLGSVSHRVAVDAPCSVRIGRGRRGPNGRPPTLLVGIDGSPGSDAAVRAVAGRAWPEGTTVHLVTSFGPYAMLGFAGDRELAQARVVHVIATDVLEEAGLKVDSKVIDGDPKRAIVEEAEQIAADCLFLGTRGLGAAGRLFLGSVSGAIAARAHCTVEIVRERLTRAQRDAEAES